MKKTIPLFLMMLLCSAVQSQNLTSIAKSADGTSEWITFRNSGNLNPVTLFSQHKQAFGLNNADEMILQKTKTDPLGFTHYRYIQSYRGIPVYGADYILHQKNGKLQSGNGKLVTGLNLNTLPALTPEQAVQKALQFIPSEQYIWQNAFREAILKKDTKNPDATFYPGAELMIMDKKYGKDASQYRLVYKVEVYSLKPLKREFVFVDAASGEIYHHLNMLMTDDVPAVAHTRYDGIQNITADSLAPNSYRLRETGRGNGVNTYNMNNQENYSLATDFTDTDNYWNTDSVGTEAHWASEMTYDYYWNTFGRNSYNNAGAALNSFVHYGTNFANAFWDGSSMTYGDGMGSYSEFTTLDICGHEITHAVSENEANLIYQNEPGALSESFSDIFGTCIEFYAVPDPNWACGEDIGDTLRFLNDPKHGQQPDTYLGEYWEFDPANDNGGVHQNCSVGNYWFYLLTMGGSGVNDNNTSYSVTGVGMDTSSSIAYRALTQYLTSNSQYYDFYQATMQAARDLYGDCSNPVIQCAAAWSAVGIGHAFSDSKVFMVGVNWPATACGLTEEHPVVRILYNSCTSDLAATTRIPMAYRIDNNPVVYDTLILATTWNGGDTLTYTFPTSVDLSALGMHSIDVWTRLGDTAVAWNDSIMDVQFESKLLQNFDVGVVGITSPVSGCSMGTTEPVTIQIAFWGCDSLAVDTIDVSYQVNGGIPVLESFVMPHTLFPLDTIEYTFSVQPNLSVAGTYTIDARTVYDADTLNANDQFTGYTFINPIQHQADTVTFSESNINEHYYVTSGGWGRAWVATQAANGAGKGLKMTSGNAINYMGILEFPQDSNDIWNVNAFLSAKAHFCVDASAWSTCWLKFDLKQTHGGTLYSQYFGANDYTMASNLRVLVNNTQIGGTFNPTSAGSDPFVTHYFNLSAWAGQKFDVTFETRNISSDTTIMFIPFVLDNAYLDNVCFAQVYSPGFEELQSPISSVSVFPNPSSGAYTIDCSLTDAAHVSAVLTDLLGRKVWEKEFDMNAGQNKFAVDLSQYPGGIYNMRLVSDKNVVTLKLIKN